jgi:DNA-binding NarL/FixJ family response regulator
VKKALRSGARGYLVKNSVIEELNTAIRCAYKKTTYLSSNIPEIDLSSLKSPEEEEQQSSERLTPREREIWRLVAEGYTNARIAEELAISIKTVEKHRANLMDKIGVDDITGLIREAIRQGIII